MTNECVRRAIFQASHSGTALTFALQLAMLTSGCFEHGLPDPTPDAASEADAGPETDAGPEDMEPPMACGRRDACEPGTERLNAEGCVRTYKVERCNTACEWEQLHECGKGCGSGDGFEPTHWDKERVCIYQGTTLRHCRTDGEAMMSCFDESGKLRVGDALFFESTFMMDRYPATYRRYAECVEDGACEYQNSIADADPSHIIELEIYHAVALCNWAGGRLPTVHESLRAARGDGTELPAWPWGDGAATCEGETHLPISACFVGETGLRNVAADEFPQSASPFGVQSQIGVRFFWTADHYYSGNLDSSDQVLVDYELTQDPDPEYKMYTALVGSELFNAHKVDMALHTGAYITTSAMTSVLCAYDPVR